MSVIDTATHARSPLRSLLGFIPQSRSPAENKNEAQSGRRQAVRERANEKAERTREIVRQASQEGKGDLQERAVVAERLRRNRLKT